MTDDEIKELYERVRGGGELFMHKLTFQDAARATLYARKRGVVIKVIKTRVYEPVDQTGYTLVYVPPLP